MRPRQVRPVPQGASGISRRILAGRDGACRKLYADPTTWRALVRNMRAWFECPGSSRRYLEVYRNATSAAHRHDR